MKREILKKVAEKYMAWIGSVGNTMFYFQAYRIMETEKAADVSFLGFSISAIALTSWLIYGIIRRDKALIIANTIGCIGAFLVLIGVVCYS